MAVRAGYQKPGRLFLQRLSFQELCLVLLLVTAAAAADQCPQFVFPTLPANRSITAKEHSTLVLPFSLNTDACLEPENQTFTIYVAQSPEHDNGHFCIVRVRAEEYFSFSENNCSLTKENGRNGVNFVKTVTRADSGTWLWRTSDGTVRVEVYFNIQRSPSSSSDDYDSNADTDTDHTLAPATKQRTIHRFHPVTSKPPAPYDNPDDLAGKKAIRVSSQDSKSKPQPGRDQDTGKTEEVGPNAENTMKEKSGDDNGDERPADGSVTTGVIVGMVNVITIIFVVVVVFLLVRRHSRRKRHPRDSMPPLPNDARLPGQRQETPGDVTHNYNTIASVTSSNYEVLPEPRESIAVDKDGYLEPEQATENISGSYIELIN